MLPEIKIIAKSVLALTIVGGIMGLLIAGLAAEFPSIEFFFWIALFTFVGANAGLVLAYGFLPES
ncbi:MAG: hypothetical protein ACERKX_00825 [Anaerolineales bacterium]